MSSSPCACSPAALSPTKQGNEFDFAAFTSRAHMLIKPGHCVCVLHMLKDLIVLICSLYKLWCFKPFGASVVGELWNQIEPPRLWASPHGAIPRDLPSAAADLKRLWRLWHIYPYLILFCFLVSQLYFNLSTLAYVTRCNKLQEESRHSMVHIFFWCPYVLMWFMTNTYEFRGALIQYTVQLVSSVSATQSLYQKSGCIDSTPASRGSTSSQNQPWLWESCQVSYLLHIYIYTFPYIYTYILLYIYIYTIIQYYTYIVIHRWFSSDIARFASCHVLDLCADGQLGEDDGLAVPERPWPWTMEYQITYISIYLYIYRVMNNNNNDNNNNKNNTI